MPRPGPVAALVAEGFGSRLSFGLLSFALPLYARHLGFSLVQIGLLISFATAVSLVLKPVMGSLADRWGLRRSLLASLLVRSGLCLGYLAVALPWQLFAVRGVHGVSDSIRDPAVHALLAEQSDRRTVATSFAWYQTAKTMAGSAGKGLAGVLLTLTGGYVVVFGAAFLLSLLPVLAVLLLVAPDGPRAGQQPPAPVEPPRPTAPEVKQPGVPAFAGLGFLVAGTSAMLGALFPVLATEYAGLSAAEAGLLYLVTPLLALTGPLWGHLSDRVSRGLVLSLRSGFNACSALVMLLFPTLAGMWVGRSLDDLGKAAFRPAWGSLMAEVSGRDRASRAKIMGQLTAGEDAGEIVAPVVAGVLWTVGGPPALLLARIAMAVVSEAYAIALERRVARSAHALGTGRAAPSPTDPRGSPAGTRPARNSPADLPDT